MAAKSPTIFFSVGEPSGDLHAANLMRAIRQRRPEVEFVGYGGPKMEAAGCHLHTDLTALAVMWFLRVLINIHKFAHLVGLADRYFRHHKPDAVVLVDYPGFNWWIARRAKAHGIPVFYYTPPQIWAWASWRVSKMRRFVDHVLCSLPFEEEWFNQHGCRATFVGHPFFDEVRDHPLRADFLAQQPKTTEPLILILPGSRTQEVIQNLRMQLRAAAIILSRFPDVRFVLGAFRPKQAQIARDLIAASGLPIEVFVRRTPELMSIADCCLAVSGSVSLELLYYRRPTVVCYKISRFAFRVQNYFRRVKYITLVNLLSTGELFPDDLTPYDPRQPDAERVLFPEYLTWEDRAQQMADHVIGWLADAGQAGAVVGRLGELCDRVGAGGASAKAAEYILKVLADRAPAIPRPHFLPSQQPSRLAEIGRLRPRSLSPAG